MPSQRTCGIEGGGEVGVTGMRQEYVGNQSQCDGPCPHSALCIWCVVGGGEG
jgi:hypothetical protein